LSLQSYSYQHIIHYEYHQHEDLGFTVIMPGMVIEV
jgi:hypothetical protein